MEINLLSATSVLPYLVPAEESASLVLLRRLRLEAASTFTPSVPVASAPSALERDLATRATALRQLVDSIAHLSDAWNARVARGL